MRLLTGTAALYLITLLTVVFGAIPVNLFARSLTTDRVLGLGVLTYNETSGKAQVVDLPQDLDIPEAAEAHEQFCVGAEIKGNFQCHSLQVLSKPLNYDLILSTKPTTGELFSMSFKKSTRKSASGINAIIRIASAGPKPSLKEVKAEKSTVTGEVEEEEVPQSFIQKYWMFLVPVVILLMTSGGQ